MCIYKKKWKVLNKIRKGHPEETKTIRTICQSFTEKKIATFRNDFHFDGVNGLK